MTDSTLTVRPVFKGSILTRTEITEEFKKYDPNSYPKECLNENTPYTCLSKDMTTIDMAILQEFWGRPFDAAFYSLLSAFKPSMVRVIGLNFDSPLLDSFPNRISVYVNADKIVEQVLWEASVSPPVGFLLGHDLKIIVKFGLPPTNEECPIHYPCIIEPPCTS